MFPGHEELIEREYRILVGDKDAVLTEPDGKGVPVLLRQYLKLNATLLEFNVDPDFANCLDALVMVDLRSAPVAILQRYMGKDCYQRFNRESAQ